MNRILIIQPRLCRAILCCLIAFCGSVANAAVLADFGHGTMRVDNQSALGTRPLLVITAVFTNYGPSLVWGNNALTERVFGGGTSRSLNGYLAENSNQRFQWTNVGVVGPLEFGAGETLDAFEAAVAASGTNDAHLFERLWFSNIIARVMVEGAFNFLPFDTTPTDSVVAGSELSILIFSNDTGSPGMNRPTGRVEPAGAPVAVDSKATCVRDSQTFQMLLHEGLHLLSTADVYGRLGISRHLSIMAGNSDPMRIYHLDPWHKMLLGWSEPRIFQLETGGVVNLPAAQLGDSLAPIILYDSTQGVDEYFMLEYRATNLSSGAGYDSGVAGEGLVVWNIAQKANHYPEDYANVAYPDLEVGWRLCENCWSLTQEADASKPCASTNHPSHDLQDWRADRRLVKDEPSAPGENGWRSCSKCGGLFFGPEQAGSVCPAGGIHDGSSSPDYTLSQDPPPDLVRDHTCHRCWKCELLFFHHPDPAKRISACPAGGLHSPAANAYALVAVGNPAMMSRGAIDLAFGGNSVWTNSMVTPNLGWYDGATTPYRLFVRPFNPGDDSIMVEWWNESDAWVDFTYGGTEDGSFARPWNTLAEGLNGVPHGGTLHFKAGQSSESARTEKRMKMEAYGGPVILGR